MSTNAKKPKTAKKGVSDKMLTRILCIILMVLMVGGLLIGAIYYLFNGQLIRASALGGEETIRVGLMFGTGVTVGFETTAPNGFVPGAVASDNSFAELWTIDNQVVSVTIDDNLYATGGPTTRTYSKNSSFSAAIGGFHIQSEQMFSSRAEAESAFLSISSDASRTGISSFVAYLGNGYAIRSGDFFSSDAAYGALAAYGGVIGGYACSVVSPSATCVSIVDPTNDSILFEFDGQGDAQLGLFPVQTGGETAYIKTPAGNTYCGVFEYSRWRDGLIDGVAVTNVIDIDEYVMGVIPYEIGNAWSLEAQKAFAIAVRGYALANLNKHAKYNFDLCNDADCQAYRGMRLVNDTVRDAAFSTAGKVLTYNGEIVSTYFSAVTGGCTVSAEDAWGSTAVPYIKAVATPWEDFASHANGEWCDEYSPYELLARVRKNINERYPSMASSFRLVDSISSIKIDSLAKNSSYVYSLTLTDPYGNSFTLEKTDVIRRVIGLYSANFVTGRAGETVERTVFLASGTTQISLPSAPVTAPDPVLFAPTSSGVRVMTGNAVELFNLGESITVAVGGSGRADSVNVVSLSDLTVISQTGKQSYNMEEEYVNSLVTGNIPASTSATGTDYSSATYTASKEQVALPGNSGNFVFLGRGWGHGVGLSQIGIRDLAANGYSCEQILTAYLPDTRVLDYRTLAAFAH